MFSAQRWIFSGVTANQSRDAPVVEGRQYRAIYRLQSYRALSRTTVFWEAVQSPSLLHYITYLYAEKNWWDFEKGSQESFILQVPTKSLWPFELLAISISTPSPSKVRRKHKTDFIEFHWTVLLNLLVLSTKHHIITQKQLFSQSSELNESAQISRS